jgi:hypothetical protein
MGFAKEMDDFVEGWEAVDRSLTSRANRAYTKMRTEKERSWDPSDPGPGMPAPGTMPGIPEAEPGTDPDTSQPAKDTMPNVGGQDIGQYMYDYYRNKGLGHVASASIVGNLMRESGGDPRVLSGARTGDAGASYYVGQWNNSGAPQGQPGRLDNLNAFAKARGNPKPTLQDQLDFVLEEMNPKSPYVDAQAAKMFPQLQAATDLSTGVKLFQMGFERPLDPEGDFAPRLKYAQAFGDAGNYKTDAFTFDTAGAGAGGGTTPEKEQKVSDARAPESAGGGEKAPESLSANLSFDIPELTIPEITANFVPPPDSSDQLALLQRDQQIQAGGTSPWLNPESRPAMWAQEGGVIPEPVQMFADGGAPVGAITVPRPVYNPANPSAVGGIDRYSPTRAYTQPIPAAAGSVPGPHRVGYLGLPGASATPEVSDSVKRFRDVRAASAAREKAAAEAKAAAKAAAAAAAAKAAADAAALKNQRSSRDRQFGPYTDEYGRLGYNYRGGANRSGSGYSTSGGYQGGIGGAYGGNTVGGGFSGSGSGWGGIGGYGKGVGKGGNTSASQGKGGLYQEGGVIPELDDSVQQPEPNGVAYAQGGRVATVDPVYWQVVKSKHRQMSSRGEEAGQSARDRAAREVTQGRSTAVRVGEEETPRKVGKKGAAVKAKGKAKKGKKAAPEALPEAAPTPTPRPEPLPTEIQRNPYETQRTDLPTDIQRNPYETQRGDVPVPESATPMPNERNIPTVPYGTAGTPTEGYNPEPAIPMPAERAQPTVPYGTAGTPTEGYNPPNVATRTVPIPRAPEPPPTDEEVTQKIRTQAAEEAATRARLRSGTPKGAMIGGQFVAFGPDDKVVPGGAFIGGQWVPQDQLQFARGGAVPEEDDPMLPRPMSGRAEEAGYTTSAPGYRGGASSARQPSAPAAPAPRDEEPAQDKYRPTPELMSQVRQAAAGGARFIGRHFGIDQQQTGAIPSPEGDAQSQAGAQRFAEGEGAATPDEIQRIDAKIGLPADMPEGDKNMERMARMMNWYLARGRKDDAEAAAASLMMYGANRVSQLGNLAAVAYQKGDLDRTMKYLEKAYEMIPDGGALDVTLDRKAGKFLATHIDAEGNETTHVVTPQELPGLIQQVQSKSVFWQSVSRLGDPEGARSRDVEEREIRREGREAVREGAKTREQRSYTEGYEEYKHRRDQEEARAKEEREADRKAAEDKAKSDAELAKEERANAEADRRAARQEALLRDRWKNDPDKKGTDWTAVSPLWTEARKALTAVQNDKSPENQQALDEAASRLWDALPGKDPKVRGDQLGEMGIYPEDFTYVSKVAEEMTTPPVPDNAAPAAGAAQAAPAPAPARPADPNAPKLAPNGKWYRPDPANPGKFIETTAPSP